MDDSEGSSSKPWTNEIILYQVLCERRVRSGCWLAEWRGALVINWIYPTKHEKQTVAKEYRHRVVNTADKPMHYLLQIDFTTQKLCTWSENLIVRQQI